MSTSMVAVSFRLYAFDLYKYGFFLQSVLSFCHYSAIPVCNQAYTQKYAENQPYFFTIDFLTVIYLLTARKTVSQAVFITSFLDNKH